MKGGRFFKYNERSKLNNIKNKYVVLISSFHPLSNDFNELYPQIKGPKDTPYVEI